jgi:predicted  nucleic acid-binding Zn-ribbon protein
VHADLERLIRLQKLDTAADEARRMVAAVPERLAAIDTRLDTARGAVAAARARLDENQAARRAIEKDLSVVQTRLSRFKDQLMEVKTNREYQAMQKEIETAQHEVEAFEGRVLERMLEADELTAALRAAEARLKEEEKAAAEERKTVETDGRANEARLDEIAQGRLAIVAGLPPGVLLVFEQVSRTRKGVAVAEARDGLCSLCHVRLRPQVYTEVRRNEGVIQCESCQRILYYEAPPPSGGQQS